ncbi:hypothetical protein [Streptomyces uncialis]|uniref:hypothetical protein n=1 Tax=Streptomyces uncialis TaxID=1048205 RepID=UPI003867AD1F|nr:hypothetical protein OG924_18530 [Streptomyces uncialis]
MATSAEPKYQGLIFDFFGVLTFNMVEVISYFEDREGLARGTFLRGWADPRGQELFRRLEPAERCLFVDDSEQNLAAAHRLGITPLLALDEVVAARRLRELLGLTDE